MYIGIKDGKVYDIVGDLRNKRFKGLPEELEDKFYIIIDKIGDILVDDTWDFENNISLMDAPIRFVEPEKSELEILKEKCDDLEARLKTIEEKT